MHEDPGQSRWQSCFTGSNRTGLLVKLTLQIITSVSPMSSRIASGEVVTLETKALQHTAA